MLCSNELYTMVNFLPCTSKSEVGPTPVATLKVVTLSLWPSTTCNVLVCWLETKTRSATLLTIMVGLGAPPPQETRKKQAEKTHIKKARCMLRCPRFSVIMSRNRDYNKASARSAEVAVSCKHMPSNFLERVQRGPLLCDGAMGTLLYAKGIFINRCYDELNLSQPELIRGIHQEYLQAGAEVIETNTFGANSFRLARHGFAEQTREINLAGARLARELVTKKESGRNFFVAASVGPLGLRIEPLGKISLEETRESFRQQIAALVEGGVDVIFLETFGYLEEIHL